MNKTEEVIHGLELKQKRKNKMSHVDVLEFLNLDY